MRFSHQNTESVRQSVCGIIFCLIVWSHIIIFHHNWGSQSIIRKLLCPFLSQNEISWPSLYSLKNVKVCCFVSGADNRFWKHMFIVSFLLIHLTVWVICTILMWLYGLFAFSFQIWMHHQWHPKYGLKKYA